MRLPVIKRTRKKPISPIIFFITFICRLSKTLSDNSKRIIPDDQHNAASKAYTSPAFIFNQILLYKGVVDFSYIGNNCMNRFIIAYINFDGRFKHKNYNFQELL